MNNLREKIWKIVFSFWFCAGGIAIIYFSIVISPSKKIAFGGSFAGIIIILYALFLIWKKLPYLRNIKE